MSSTNVESISRSILPLTQLSCDDDELQVASRAIRALSSPARLRILCLLFAGEKSVVELTRLIDGHTQSSISQHLSFLLKNGIVSNRKFKTQMRYRINDGRVEFLIRLVSEIFCARQRGGSQPVGFAPSSRLS